MSDVSPTESDKKRAARPHFAFWLCVFLLMIPVLAMDFIVSGELGLGGVVSAAEFLAWIVFFMALFWLLPRLAAALRPRK